MDLSKFLDEDQAHNDVTTRAIVDFLGTEPELSFDLLAKEPGIFSGKRWLQEFEKKDLLRFKEVFDEGKAFSAGTVVAVGIGRATKVLGVERTLLNGLQYLCGVATQTAKYASRVKEIAVGKRMPAPAILHTRKILPGLRDFIADALAAGGAGRHRFTLADRILVKDNHYQLLKSEEKLKEFLKHLSLEDLGSALFEADSEARAQLLVQCGVHNLMLDNFSKAQLEKFLPTLPKHLVIELSGGIKFESLEDFVLPGVHRISIGALTHGARSLDISLEVKDGA